MPPGSTWSISTNELVEWFNQVDATYRSELRDLNDRNFARFEAKLDQRVAELRSELREEMAQLRGDVRTGMASLEGGPLACLGMAEGRLARLTLLLWMWTLGALIALLKF